MRNYDAIKPLLIAADVRDLRQPIDAHDKAVDQWRQASGEAQQPRGSRREHARFAYRAAVRAHAGDPRAPKPDYAAVAAADDIDAEVEDRVRALEDAVADRMVELDQAVAEHVAPLAHFVAVTRTQHGDGPYPHPLSELYAQLTIPRPVSDVAYVSGNGDLNRWSLPPLYVEPTAVAGRPHAEAFVEHAQWWFEQLAHTSRYDWRDGRLAFSTVWTPSPLVRGSRTRSGQHPSVLIPADADRGGLLQPAGGGFFGRRERLAMDSLAVNHQTLDIEPGDVVRVGDGPNGEPGIDHVWWRQQLADRRALAAFGPAVVYP